VVVLARDNENSSFDVFVVSRNARQLFTSKVFFPPLLTCSLTQILGSENRECFR
jgi:hypothetical protein